MKTLLNLIKKKKRGLTYITALLLFVAYFLLIDPNNSIRGIIITMQILIISFIMIIMIEFLPDIILDPIYGNEKDLVEISKGNPDAASRVLLAKSFRLLGYAIIAAGAIIAFTST